MLHQHLDHVQGDLDAMKEMLRNGEEYQFDVNTLLNVSTSIDKVKSERNILLTAEFRCSGYL